MKAIRPYGDEIKSGGTSSILASLYRTMLSDLCIDEVRFNTMMQKYILRGVKNNTIKDASSKRGNLRNELMQDTMTWTAFIEGLEFINAKKINFSILLNPNADDCSEHFENAIIISKDPIPDDKNADKMLARLFRKILFERNYELTKFSELMDEYISKSSGPNNIYDVSSRKGNFKKELLKNRMSWNVFVKGLVFFKIEEFIITLTVSHSNGKVTVHTKHIHLGN